VPRRHADHAVLIRRSRVEPVPITPSVLEWAIAESGLSVDAVASAVGVTREEFDRWLSGASTPTASSVRAIARRLHRQVATFLLPRPPFEAPLRVQFRHPIGGRRGGSLSDVERRFIRRAHRLQAAERWLADALGRPIQEIPQEPITTSATSVAEAWRRRSGVTLEAQLGWRSGAAALDTWQRAIEGCGVTVLRLSMGSESCRGFCLWDQRAPMIAVNAVWTDEARVVTLFHQLGHLITRTDSACAAAPVIANSDQLERWCETFASTLLLPAEALAPIAPVARLAEVALLARRFRVSLRAMALRLIELDKASWRVYDEIPGASDAKRGDTAARKDRDGLEMELGGRIAAVFVTAVRRNIISLSQALDDMDMALADFERIAARIAS
jgi:Zn-dependent peptidase ImmA (M78 family)